MLEQIGGYFMNLIRSFFNAIPNVVVAILWLILAFVVAGIVKGMVIKLLKAVKAEQYLAKLGVKDVSTNTAIDFVGKLVYFIVFLLFLPGALNKLGLASVASPITNVVGSFLAMIPSILGAIIVLVVGLFIAKLVKELLIPVLKALKVDDFQAKAGIKAKENTSFSVIIANIVYAVIALVVIVQSLNMLNLPILTRVGTSIIDYLPAILSVIIVLAIALFLANTVESLIAKKFPKAKGAAFAAKVAIYVIAAFMCLSQLNIAAEIVNATFILVVAALCVAFAISFGVGGRFFAQNTLKKLEDKLNGEDDKK